jgi:hypothetical protein
MLVGIGFLQYHWSGGPVAAMAGASIDRINARINNMHVKNDTSFALLPVSLWSFIVL